MEKISRRDARKKGLSRYFTGVECKNGHIAERYSVSCACVECSLEARREGKNKRMSVDYLKECFMYDEAEGVLVWKHRPRNHFVSDFYWEYFNREKAGTVAGNYSKRSKDSSLHVYVVCIREGTLLGHSVIWAITHGYFPQDRGLEIDHIDGNPSNNKPNNLRIVTRKENSMNVGIRSNNTSGYSGVNYSKEKNKWRVRISIDKKKFS